MACELGRVDTVLSNRKLSVVETQDQVAWTGKGQGRPGKGVYSGNILKSASKRDELMKQKQRDGEEETVKNEEVELSFVHVTFGEEENHPSSDIDQGLEIQDQPQRENKSSKINSESPAYGVW